MLVESFLLEVSVLVVLILLFVALAVLALIVARVVYEDNHTSLVVHGIYPSSGVTLFAAIGGSLASELTQLRVKFSSIGGRLSL